MRVLFMGSGEVACPALQRLVNDPSYDVVGVVTQPDRPKGRRRILQPCIAKVLAEKHDLKVLTPEKVGDPESVEALRALKPDVIVVAAYGQYIKPAILDMPPHGSINIHPSLLPKYRGASPIQWALANGERATGVTILYVSKEMDAGDIICQEAYPIDDADTTETLSPRLAELGADLLLRALEDIRSGCVTRQPQDPEAVTYVTKLEKEDGHIDWSLPAHVIRNRIRGFTPWPGCFTFVHGSMLKVRRARVEPIPGEAQGSEPGTVLCCAQEGPLIATGDGALRLLDVQPEGKAVMPARAYLCGHALNPGERL